MQLGQGQEALSIYRSLPAAVQKMKYVMLLRIAAAGKTPNGNAYVQSIAEYRSAFPNDASQHLISIDYFVLKKQYDEGIKSIDKLDKAVGGDPYLNEMRAGIYRQAGNFSKAREFEQRGRAAQANSKRNK